MVSERRRSAGDRPAIGTVMAHRGTLAHDGNQSPEITQLLERKEIVSKRGRKKRDRKKSAANHGKRPNS